MYNLVHVFRGCDVAFILCWCERRAGCSQLMSHWQFIGTDLSDIGKCCLSAVRDMEAGQCFLHLLVSFLNVLSAY